VSEQPRRTPSAVPVEWLTGKVVPLLLWSLLLASEILALTQKAGEMARSGWRDDLTLEVARHVLTLSFFLLVLAAYITRIGAVSRAVGFRERVLPMLIFLSGPAGIFFLQLLDLPPRFQVSRVAVALSVAGLALSLWSLWHLRSAFSILAEARRVVHTGPYRLVRHPLYLGEAVTMLGLCLLQGSLTALVFWAAFNALQLVRARIEENKLAREFPDYRAYRQRTRFILPGLY
jgi:protein-S-isoprenylcysteine O-methyltransferase Ste14